MSGGGTSTNTVQTSSSPPGNFIDAYNSLLGQGQNLASQPYQPYTGSLVAPLSPDQQAGITATQNAVGVANPFINAAAQEINNSTTPIWSNAMQFSPEAISQYESPYTQQVVQATQNEFNNQNAQQQQQVIGNAISAGAWGGDRSAVAQGIVAGQQALAQAPVIANLENQGYAQALNEFNTQQQAQIGANEANNWLSSQAGYGLANLGNQALQSSLTGANALLGIGGLEQSQAQQELNVPYQQYTQAQAYPYQMASWLQGLETNLGSSAGGTGTTTSPGANPWSTAAGLGLTGAGIIGGTGGFGSNGWLTGALSGLGSGLTSAAPTYAGLLGGSAATSAALGTAAAGGTDFASLLASGLIAMKEGGALPEDDEQPRAPGGIIVPFPSHTAPMAGIGGIGPHHNDNAMPHYKPLKLAAGGIALPTLPTPAGVTTFQGNGGVMIPQLTGIGGTGGAVSPSTGGGISPVTSYLDAVKSTASTALPSVTGLGQVGAPSGSGQAATLPAGISQTAPTPMTMQQVATFQPAGDQVSFANNPAIAAQVQAQHSNPSGLANVTWEGQNYSIPTYLYGDPYDRSGGGGQARGGVVAHRDAGGDLGDDEAGPGPMMLADASPQLPRGIRNNNPLNLEFRGQPGATSDGRFAVFPDMASGMSAADQQILRNAARGARTVTDLVNMWAPGAEKGNNPNAYARTVASLTGIGPTDPVDWSDSGMRSRIEQAMAQVENGRPVVAHSQDPDIQAAMRGSGQGAGIAPTPQLPEYHPPHVDHSPWRDLLYAGLGIMGGNSPNAAANIGRGALAGIGLAERQHQQEVQEAGTEAEREYSAQARNIQQQEAMRHNRVDEQTAAQRLSQAADEARERIRQAAENHDLAVQRFNAEFPNWAQPEGAPPAAGSAVPGPGGTATPSAAATQTAKVDTPQKVDLSAAVQSGNLPEPQRNEDYLKTLPPAIGTQVKALAEGRMQFPSGFALAKPYWQNMVTAVSRYDPSFDMTDFSTRAATRKAFNANGTAAMQVTSLNRALEHLADLKDAGDSLQNGSVPLWNTLKNFVGQQSGKPELDNFNTAKSAVASELEKAFRGNGTAIAGIEDWKRQLSGSMSPAQQQAVWGQLTNLLNAQVDALSEQYSRGMGVSRDNFTLLGPDAQKAYEHINAAPADVRTYDQRGQRVPSAGQAAPTGANLQAEPPPRGVPPRPAWVPPGAAYSPSRGVWGDPATGRIYTAP